MAEQAQLETTEHGKVPKGDGWFILHAEEAQWIRSDRFGIGCRFEGEPYFPEMGVHLRVLEPGKPACLYHRESAQEDFFVISGECKVLIEEEEYSLRAGHFVHCPAGTTHVFVGGEKPCVMLMIGHRPENLELCYPVSELAARYGASAAEETPDPKKAYGERKIEHIEPMWPLYGHE